MNKKTILIIVIMLMFAGGAIYWLSRLPSVPNAAVNAQAGGTPSAVQPPTSKTVPVSGTKGIETWTGTLELGKGVFFKVGDKTYTLQAPGVDLKNRGYQTGDTVNVMGKLNGGIIEVVGMNKLIK